MIEPTSAAADDTSPPDATSLVLATSADTGGAFALVAVTLPPYYPGAPLHSHPHHAEGCYVLGGTLALTQDTRTITLAHGAAATVPPGVAHSYWNPTAAPTIILLIYTPGGVAAEVAALAAGSHGSA